MFFVFEGPDGVGKSMLVASVANRLKELNIPSESFAFPGNQKGTIGELVHELYHNPSKFGISKISIAAEQLLFTAAHADVIENAVLPALFHAKCVLLDRYWWSTWVYAKSGNLDETMLHLLIEIERSIWKRVSPDCIFLIRRQQPRFSEHSIGKWKRLVSLYNRISEEQSASVHVVDIDNDGDFETTVMTTMDAVLSRLNRPKS